MCGIAGIFDLDDRGAPHGELVAMANAIVHRGPDDAGYVSIDRVARSLRPFNPDELNDAGSDRGGWANRNSIVLAHRRFAIIDLSKNGHQPFISTNRKCIVVFNGEIYNYLELRAELESEGISFRSKSDTEVLTEAYLHWGTDCFSRFNGSWAVAIYDLERSKLILSRDRLGKKPLYWTRQGSRIYFASEIKALLAVDAFSRHRSVNLLAASKWLSYNKKNDDTQTFFKNIYSFPAASWADVKPNFPEGMVSYWSLPTERLRETDLSVGEAASQLRTLLRDAVALRMRADVPIGIELSGGIDSSILAALCSETSATPIRTDTVVVSRSDLDESKYAASIAERFATSHHEHHLKDMHFWSVAEQFTHLHEEPYHSPNLFSNQAIWAELRASGVKVSINGGGADELFGGYWSYFTPAMVDMLSNGQFTAAIRNILDWSESGSSMRSVATFGSQLTRRSIKRFAPNAFDRLIRSNHLRTLPFIPRPRSPMGLSALSAKDITSHLIPYWMCSGDKNYMGVPIEVRCPFLDYRVVEFASELPIGYLVRDGWHKWIMRKAFSDLLPYDVVWRRKKLGFPIDLSKFMTSSISIFDLLARSARIPFLPGLTPGLLRNNWALASFVLWYEYFFNNNHELFTNIQRLAPSETVLSPFRMTYLSESVT